MTKKITSLLSVWGVLLAAQVISLTVRGLRDRVGGHWLDDGFSLMVDKRQRKALSSVWKSFAGCHSLDRARLNCDWTIRSPCLKIGNARDQR